MGNCFRRQDSELQLTHHDSIVHQQSDYVTSHNSVRGSVPTTPTSVVAATKPSDVDLAVQACKFLKHILVRYHAVPQSETGLGKGDVKCLRNIFVIQLVLCYLNTLVLWYFDYDEFWFLYKCYIQLYPSSYVRVGSKRYTYISHNPDTKLVTNPYVNIKAANSFKFSHRCENKGSQS